MSDDTLFGGDQSATPEAGQIPAAAATPSIEMPNEVAELIGEGKKYADLGSALSSIAPAQEHIARIEKENASMRQALEKATKLEDVLSKIDPDRKPAEQTAQPEAVDPAKLVELVRASLKQDEQVNRETANLGTVQGKLTEVYGDKAEEKFAEAAGKVGMTGAALKALAKSSPEAALALIGVPKAEGTPGIAEGDVNPGALKGTGEQASKKNIMYGASTKDVIDEWRASAPKT